MYALVTITAHYDAAALRQALLVQIGATRIAPLKALRRTKFARKARAMARTVIAAQAIRDTATILYFFDGPDTISVHIGAAKVAELKAQVVRVTRQLLPGLGAGSKVVEARIFVQERAAAAEAQILRGVRMSLLRQIIRIAAEKWLGKLLVPTFIFGLTSWGLAGTPAVASGLIGMVAALLAFLVEMALFVYHGSEWLWEEAS